MSITMVPMVGQLTDAGEVDDKGKTVKSERPYTFVARELDAKDYPSLDSVEIVKNKSKVRVPKLEVPPSAILWRKFDTVEDIQSAAGTKYNDFIVNVVNEYSEARTKSAVGKFIAQLKVYSGNIVDMIKDIGANVDIFTAPERGASGRKSVASNAIALAESAKAAGKSDAEVLAALMELLNANSK